MVGIFALFNTGLTVDAHPFLVKLDRVSPSWAVRALPIFRETWVHISENLPVRAQVCLQKFQLIAIANNYRQFLVRIDQACCLHASIHVNIVEDPGTGNF